MLGIDEAGRGPLAGPVVAAVVGVVGKLSDSKSILSGIRDSKHLTPKKREEWYHFITSHPQIVFSTARVYPQTIDKMNISWAANTAAYRAYKRVLADLFKKYLSQGIEPDIEILIDAGIKLPKSILYQTIIKGDESIPVIAAASVVAKFVRDNIMINMHRKYANYAFDKHKGYGTKLHIQMIKKFGTAPVHRQSFIHFL